MNIARKETRGIEGLAVCLLVCSALFAPGAVAADAVSFTSLPASLGALGNLAVPILALLCGYYCHSAARGVDDLSAFSLKAVFGLYKCYWAVLLIFLPLIVYANRQLRSLLLYELIYNSLGLRCTFNGECWPLLSFALFVLIYPAVKRLLDKPGVFAALIAQLLVLFALNAFVFAALPRIMSLSLFSTLSQTVFYSRLDEFFSLLPSFWLGCVFARHNVFDCARRLADKAICCLAALALLAVAFVLYSALGSVCAFLSAGALVFGLALLGAAKPLRFLARPFEFSGAGTPFVFFVPSFLCHTLPHGLILWPKFAVFVFLWLLVLSLGAAKLISLVCRRIDGVFAARRARRAEADAHPAEFTKRDTSVMKGVAVSLMIAHHLFTFPERLVDVGYISVPFINGMTLAACLGQFGKICVSVFTLLSGYGTYLSLSRARNDADITLRHIRSLYISYWKVFLIAVPISLLLARSFGEGTAINIVYSFLGIRLAYCSEWWFIIPFAVLIILAPCTKRFIDRPSSTFASRFLWILAANAALYYVLNPLMKTPLMSKLYESVFWAFFSSALTLWPAYALGCLFARFNVLALVKARCRKLPALWSLCALVGICALVYIHPFNWLAYDYLNGALFLACMLVLFSSRVGRFVAPVFDRLGRESTSMWLIHTLLCYHWCQKLVFAPRYAFLIFLLLLIMSYLAARLIRLLWRGVSAAATRLTPGAKAH